MANMPAPSSLLQGLVSGTTWPFRASLPLPDKDARDIALEQLRLYLGCLRFRRTMAPGQPPKPFRIPLEQIHTYQPDDVHSMKFPAIGMVPGRGYREYYGLGPPEFVPGSEGAAGPGTALLRLSDYVEGFTIEVMAAKHAIRRSIAAGIGAALRANETSTRIQLKIPGYYGIPASFSYEETMYIDEPDNVRNRRRVHLFVELRVNEVVPVNAVTLRPVVDFGAPDDSNVLDGNVYLDLEGREFTARRACTGEDS